MNVPILKEKNNIVEVATGEVKVACSPARLQCLALGSCVAVILYDEKRKIGGIAHVMLPSLTQRNGAKDVDALKYANHAIYELIKQMRALGAEKNVLTACLVGGALVIVDMPDIGKENIMAVRNILQKFNIRIVGEYLGGNVGRSVIFNVATGELYINGKMHSMENGMFVRPKKEDETKYSEHALTELEEKIVERTRELNEKIDELENVRKATFNLLDDLEKEREHLVETNVKYEAILSSIGDGLMVIDYNMKVVRVNRAGEEMLGWGQEDLLGHEWYQFIKMTDIEKKELSSIDVLFRRVFTTGRFVMQFIRKDGSIFAAALTVSPVKMGPSLLGAVIVFRDITKEQEVDRAKTEFVSLASHQLRTPLTAISWYTEMILGGNVGKVVPDQKKYLEEIYRGNQQMIKMVNTFLNVSRIELGTFKIEPTQTDIIALAQNVLDEQKQKIEEKKLVIIKNFHKNVPLFSADPNLLRIVFQNLLANAVEYTPLGGKIEFAIFLDDVKTMLIKVSDTGYGIPKNQQDKIFTKLFRADNVRNKDMDGTGLGLYIVKSIVENSGGKIWFYSPGELVSNKKLLENYGTTFYVMLPLEGMKKKEGSKTLGE